MPMTRYYSTETNNFVPSLAGRGVSGYSNEYDSWDEEQVVDSYYGSYPYMRENADHPYVVSDQVRDELYDDRHYPEYEYEPPTYVHRRNRVTAGARNSARSARGSRTRQRSAPHHQRSATIERAMQRRQRRLEQYNLKNSHRTEHTEDTIQPASRVRTRVRFIDGPEENRAKQLYSKSKENIKLKVPFYWSIIAIFVAGLAMSLWFSTQSAINAYHHDKLTNRNIILGNYVNELHKKLAEGNSSPRIYREAIKHGMVPAEDINVLEKKNGIWRTKGNEKSVKMPPHIPAYGGKRPPVHQAPPAPVAPPVHQAPPAPVAPPVHQAPPAPVTPPVHQAPHSPGSFQEKPEQPILPNTPRENNIHPPAPIPPPARQAPHPAPAAPQAPVVPAHPAGEVPVWKAPRVGVTPRP